MGSLTVSGLPSLISAAESRPRASIEARTIRIHSFYCFARRLDGAAEISVFRELFAAFAQGLYSGAQKDASLRELQEASMNAKVLIAGLVAAGSLLAQPPMGPRGGGPMGFGGPGGPGGFRRGGPGPVKTVTGAPYSAVEVRTSQR